MSRSVAAVRSIPVNGTHLKVSATESERVTAEWKCKFTGIAIGNQDVFSCSPKEAARMKGEAAYEGWHFLRLASGYIAISPIRRTH